MHPFKVNAYGRSLAAGTRSVLAIFDIDTSKKRSVFATNALIEAPNWMQDGDFLAFNAGGQLWKIATSEGMPELIDTAPLADLNNDHLISPDGQFFYLSSNDGHLYRVGTGGGYPSRVSNVHPEPFRYYLHGIAPDGKELAFVAVEGEESDAPRNLFTIPSQGGTDRRLTDVKKPNDGPEYSPDGRWIYFNSELASSIPGHAQLFRMLRDGSSIQQLTFDDRVNWFPHISPDGKTLVYLSYPPGTLGHPADKDVIIRVMTAEGGEPRDLIAFEGGQGTINVNSWAPDGRRFAYVEYPKISM